MVQGFMSSLLQCRCIHSRGIGRPSEIYAAISCAHGNPCVEQRIHPHAVLSIPTRFDLFVSTNIFSNEFHEMFPRSSSNSDGLKLCCTIVLLFSNEALILVCYNSNKLWVFA
eukprot:TRINITY_DN13723_c0_g2_i1.p2 TRINITY_DN13723_c0_g2~~TRINITY_DN13723_c0_g2_i1.p2  ORF type:complete len:112 (+),score=7.74 TRINITY_DN13723_c0_g2_i1:1069-1404(+)